MTQIDPVITGRISTARRGRKHASVSLARRRRNRTATNAIAVLTGSGMLVFGVDLEMSWWSYLASRVVVAASGVFAIWCVVRLCRRDWIFPSAALLQIAVFWTVYPSWVPHWLFFVRHRAELEVSLEGGPLPRAALTRHSVPGAEPRDEGVEWFFPWEPVFALADAYAIIYRPGPAGPRLFKHGPERRLAEGWFFSYFVD